jgi:hypothetical protein
METTQTLISKALDLANDSYYRLVILVGEPRSGKSSALTEVAATYGSEVLNVNLVLSSQLMNLSWRERVLKIPSILQSLATNNSGVLVLDNIEMLFDVDFRQDPLRLLEIMSRNTTILVSWTGLICDNKLRYAVPGHAEYREYVSSNLIKVSASQNSHQSVSRMEM